MEFDRSNTIHSADGSFAVQIDVWPEHHMGACTVHLTPSRPIAGVAHFQTTNGKAFFVEPGPILILHDACVILVHRLASDDVHFVERPKDWYFTNVRVSDGWLHSDLYSARGGRERLPPIALNEIDQLPAGFGPVKTGRFPSSWPAVP